MKPIGNKIARTKEDNSIELELWNYIRDNCDHEIRWEIFDTLEDLIDKGMPDMIRDTLYEAN